MLTRQFIKSNQVYKVGTCNITFGV